jgi:GcrA cell cycle regulator
MPGTPWTDDRIERLGALWAEGLSASEIAARLGGLTRNAVLGKLHRLGLLGGRVRSGRLSAKPPQAPKQRRAKAATQPVVRAGPAPPPRAAAPEALQLQGLVSRLELLGAHVCHWPVGDPAAEDFAFCGRPAAAGPYCAAHAAVAYLPKPLPKGRRGGAKRRRLARAT